MRKGQEGERVEVAAMSRYMYTYYIYCVTNKLSLPSFFHGATKVPNNVASSGSAKGRFVIRVVPTLCETGTFSLSGLLLSSAATYSVQ